MHVVLTITVNVIGSNCNKARFNRTHDWLLCIYCSYAVYLYKLHKLFSWIPLTKVLTQFISNLTYATTYTNVSESRPRLWTAATNTHQSQTEKYTKSKNFTLDKRKAIFTLSSSSSRCHHKIPVEIYSVAGKRHFTTNQLCWTNPSFPHRDSVVNCRQVQIKTQWDLEDDKK